MEHPIWLAPALKAAHDRSDQLHEGGEVVVVRGEPASQLPDPLDRSQLRAVGRQKQQGQQMPDAVQERLQLTGVVIAGVVHHDDHAFAAPAMAQQLTQEPLERVGVEFRRGRPDELPAIEVHRPEAGDRFARGRVQHNRILVLGRYPHPGAGSVLLEVAFVQAPQIQVSATGQSAQFFLLPQPGSGRLGLPAAGACATETPSDETGAGTGALPIRFRSASSGARSAGGRPTGPGNAQTAQGRGANRAAAAATAARPANGADPYVPRRAAPRSRVARSAAPSAARSWRPRQTIRPPRGSFGRSPPAALRAAGGRNATPPTDRFPAGWRSSSPPHPVSAVSASSSPPRNTTIAYSFMLHYLRRYV